MIIEKKRFWIDPPITNNVILHLKESQGNVKI